MGEAETSPQIAVVTGASLGLGRELAIGLTERGYTVVGIARSADTLAKGLGDHPVHCIAADVADPAQVARAFAEIRDTLGHPTLLFNNAAVYPHLDVLDETPESFMNTMAINLGGAFACCHEVLPAMVERGRGRIINVATFADLRPAPLSVAYSVSKGAARILTRALVADLGDRFPDILINDWIPGALKTRMGLADGIDPKTAAGWGIALAQMDDRVLNGLVFDRNQEHLAVHSWKQRLKTKIIGQDRPQIRLGAEKFP